jgi:hypothetical protein
MIKFIGHLGHLLNFPFGEGSSFINLSIFWVMEGFSKISSMWQQVMT